MHGTETWWVVCPKCGKERNLSDTSAARVGARSRGKRILARRTGCNKVVFARLEQRT